MDEFKPLSLEAMDELMPFFEQKESLFCDYSIGGRFMWREYFQMEYIIVDETLIIKNIDDGKLFFELPVGNNWLKAFAFIWDYCKKHREQLRFAILDPDDVAVLRKYFFKMRLSYERGWSDYIYAAEPFKLFKGKKYNKKRNHLNGFHKAYPNHSVEELNEDNLAELRSFFVDYRNRHSKESPVYIEENNRVLEVLDHLDYYKMFGLILRVDGQIIAFSMGEKIGETLYVHIEKAETDYRGAYTKIAYEFANWFVDESIKWINREEDTNDMGLRQSKFSYKPDMIANKYMLEVLPRKIETLLM